MEGHTRCWTKGGAVGSKPKERKKEGSLHRFSMARKDEQRGPRRDEENMEWETERENEEEAMGKGQPSEERGRNIRKKGGRLPPQPRAQMKTKAGPREEGRAPLH